MDLSLLAAVVLMGAAGMPHCAAMCGTPCAALLRRCGGAPLGPAGAAFVAGRVAGYAVAGALAAGSVGALSELARLAPVLRPLWVLFHAAVLALGLWMAFSGRVPERALGRAAARPQAAALAGGWQRMSGPLQAGAAGGAWGLMPCGLLQSALLVAALASTPAQGALAMAGFAAASSAGVLAPLTLLGRRALGGPARAGFTRAAGVLLAASSGWALGHGLWERVAALCAS
jgi:hypothetical protein